MALSEANTLTLCQIFDVIKLDMDLQIDFMGDRLTAAVQAAIEDQLDLWDDLGAKTTRLLPTESNKGVKTDPDMARQFIRSDIAVLLERPDWASSGSGNYLPRG